MSLFKDLLKVARVELSKTETQQKLMARAAAAVPELVPLVAEAQGLFDVLQQAKSKAIALENKLRPLEDLSGLLPVSPVGEAELLDVEGKPIKKVKVI